MTRQEVQGLLSMIQATYSNYRPENKTAAVNAWEMAMGDYSKEQCYIAFRAYIQSDASGFSPTPGQLIDIIHRMTNAQQLTEGEAWSLVSKAIRNGIYNYKEEFAKLPDDVQRTIGMPERLRTLAMDENYNEEVESSNFMRQYREVAKRSRNTSKMPAYVRQQIENANEDSLYAEIEKKRRNCNEEATMPKHLIADASAKMIREEIEDSRKRCGAH